MFKYYWDGLNNIWWSGVASNWQVLGQQSADAEYGDASYYDKRVNVLKAYLESIIAALSVTIPTIKCSPDDADNPADVSTAKAGDKISALCRKHNNADLLWLHALYILCTEGTIFSYNYAKEDEKYGTYEQPEYKDENVEARVCPECGGNVDEQFIGREIDEFDPDTADAALHALIYEGEIVCPQCSAMLDPELQKSTLIVPRLIGMKTKAKSRICIEVYGGLFVKVPSYIVTLADSPYLEYSYETNYVNIRERYQHLKGADAEFLKRIGPGEDGVHDPYERQGRVSTQYLGEYPTNTITVRNLWLRPSAYHYISEEKDVAELKAKFPDGCKVIRIQNEIVEAFNESLDDHWTSTKNPLADFIHTQPLAQSLTSVQDITNEIISLTLQTIEHGIPQTFADPSVLNFDQYNQTEVLVGGVYPAKAKTGQRVADGFHEVKTAQLSQEVLPFGQEIQQLGQLSSGALPSLFGGAQPNSSKTASQYITSKNQAQQRLQNTWKMLCIWWKELNSKVIPLYIKESVGDEKFVERDVNGSYVNAFIRKSELQGKIGDIELEAAENLPISPMQKKDTLMQFLQAANPEITSALIDPQNLPFIAEAVGLENLSLPGANDRQVQLEEIVDLVNSTPIPNMRPMMDPMSGMPVEEISEMDGLPTGQPAMEEFEEPSVPIEPDVDNDEIHVHICRNWLTGEVGRTAKIENPDGYKNVLLHMKAHLDRIQQLQMQQQMQMMQQQELAGKGPSGGNAGKPANDKMAAPSKDKMHEATT
jgi:hypothetical protein